MFPASPSCCRCLSTLLASAPLLFAALSPLLSRIPLPLPLLHITPGRQIFPDNVGKPEVDCRSELSPQEITNRTGYYAMPYESIRSIAHGYVTVGICTSQIRDHAPSYAHWIRKYRMFNRDWATFAVQSPEQDAVVLLFDLLYEKLAIFTRQYWLGEQGRGWVGGGGRGCWPLGGRGWGERQNRVPERCYFQVPALAG